MYGPWPTEVVRIQIGDSDVVGETCGETVQDDNHLVVQSIFVAPSSGSHAPVGQAPLRKSLRDDEHAQTLACDDVQAVREAADGESCTPHACQHLDAKSDHAFLPGW